ncbi:MAG: hypothetical protein ACYC3L_03455 [Gemmatimonadaceae bacterium]
MPLRRWLDSRVEEAPAALKARIGRLVDAHPEWEQMPVPEALIAASDVLMADVLAANARDRRTALDLLAADACVTYAFEAAAETPLMLVGLAERSMRHMALLVARDGQELPL